MNSNFENAGLGPRLPAGCSPFCWKVLYPGGAPGPRRVIPLLGEKLLPPLRWPVRSCEATPERAAARRAERREITWALAG